MICKEWQTQLPTEDEKMPSVVLAVFVEMPTPFLQDVLEQIYQIDYPKSKMHLWVHNSVSDNIQTRGLSSFIGLVVRVVIFYYVTVPEKRGKMLKASLLFFILDQLIVIYSIIHHDVSAETTSVTDVRMIQKFERINMFMSFKFLYHPNISHLRKADVVSAETSRCIIEYITIS